MEGRHCDVLEVKVKGLLLYTVGIPLVLNMAWIQQVPDDYKNDWPRKQQIDEDKSNIY